LANREKGGREIKKEGITMKGVIVLALKEMVIKKFGPETWDNILAKSRVDKGPLFLPISDIDDQVVLRMIHSVGEILRLSPVQVADAFGEYWVTVYSQKIYRAYYEGCKTAKDFLLKMDAVHVAATRSLPNAHPPRFEYTWKDEKTLIMKYKSPRGLIDFMIGLIRGVGKFYGEALTVTKLGNDEAEIIFP